LVGNVRHCDSHHEGVIKLRRGMRAATRRAVVTPGR
jgi:hypothetical protein